MPSTTSPIDSPRSDIVPPRAPRLRPHAAVIVLIFLLLGAAWLGRRAAADGAMKNVSLLFGGSLAFWILFGWFVFRSDYSRRWRWLSVLLVVGAFAVFGLLFRVERFDGSLVPTLAYRNAPARDTQLSPDLTEELTNVKPDLSRTSETDFPGFLGKDGNNRVDGVVLDRDWVTHPPKLLWKREVGAGWSGFAVVNGFACTLEQRGPRELVTCYEVETGKPCWTHAIEARHATSLGYVGPRSTPTIYKGKVFVLGATGVVRCLDGATGQPLWTRDLPKDFSMSQSESEAGVAWGRSASPLAFEDMLIVPAGGMPKGKQAGLVALEIDSGATRWESEAFQVSYASPRLAVLQGVPQILVVNEDVVSSHDPATGKTLWTYEWLGKSNTNANSSQPVPLSESQILLSKGYGKGSELIEVFFDDGEWSVVALWDNKRALRTKFSNVAVREGHVYGLDERYLQCVDPEGGDVVWTSQHQFGYGQLLLVGDALLVMSEEGELYLVEASADGYHELGKFQALEGQTWNTFCLVQNRLLVRNSEEAACYELLLAD